MSRIELGTRSCRKGHRWPVQRADSSRALPIALLALLTLWILVSAAPSAGAGPSELALPGFPDITGVSGESQAVFLNPSAAVGLRRPSVGLWAVVPDPKHGSAPIYALTLLDSGGRLAGGLVATLTDTEAGQPLSLSYSAAGRLGLFALGLRPVWTRQDLPEGIWTLDAGLTLGLAPWASLAIAALDLPIKQPDPKFVSRGLAGLTLTATGLAGTVLEGTQLSLGASDPDLNADDDLVARAGLLLPVGGWVRLAAVYEHDTGSSEPLGWSGSLALRAGQFLLDVGYQPDTIYHVGIEVVW